MGINKVTYSGNTLIDLTDTTASTDSVNEGEVFYDRGGNRSVGTRVDNVLDIQINDVSIISDKVADIKTKGVYDASSNKILTESDMPEIPTKLSDLSDDSTHRLTTDSEKATWSNKSDFSGSYNDLTDKPTIPDVSNFITKDVNDLTYYTLKTSTGSLIDLAINQSTYVVTLSLKDIDGNVISSDSIDLPIESVVVSGSYDSTNQKIVLTLQNGNTIDIPVGSLISGLQSEITSSNKLASDLVDDSNSGNKFVTSSEKTSWSGKQDTLIAGTNISIASDGKTISATDTTYNDATTSVSGLMSASDKTKLNGIASGAEVNVQANWNEASSSSDAYIKNKPTIPSKTSQLTNDSGYTTNTGTITSVKMNGSTVSSSGEADLGTVLTSHQNIKTINSTSLVGTGDVTVQPTLVSGTNIKTINNTSLLGSGNISISSGGDVSDVEVDGNSVVSSGVASIVSYNGDYDPDGNGFATYNDIVQPSIDNTPFTDIFTASGMYDGIDNKLATMDDVRFALAYGFSRNSTYNKGDLVVYEQDFYECLYDGVTGVWDSSNWRIISGFSDWVREIITYKLNHNVIANTYSSSLTYSVGTYVIHNNGLDSSLYVCKTAITSPEAWNSNHWDEVQLMDLIGNIESLLGGI